MIFFLSIFAILSKNTTIWNKAKNEEKFQWCAVRKFVNYDCDGLYWSKEANDRTLCFRPIYIYCQTGYDVEVESFMLIGGSCLYDALP